MAEDIEIPVPQDPRTMTPAQQKELADKVMAGIDDDPSGWPMLPLNLGKLTVWALEAMMIPCDDFGKKEPGIVITFGGPDDPKGTPYIFNRDRALKLASQIKKIVSAGPQDVPEPSVAERLQAAGLSVPGSGLSIVGG